MSICENCGKKTVVIYAINEGNVCGECKDKINREEENGRSDKKF